MVRHKVIKTGKQRDQMDELSSGSQSVVQKALGGFPRSSGGQRGKKYFHNKILFTFFTVILLRGYSGVFQRLHNQ